MSKIRRLDPTEKLERAIRALERCAESAEGERNLADFAVRLLNEALAELRKPEDAPT